MVGSILFYLILQPEPLDAIGGKGGKVFTRVSFFGSKWDDIME